MAGDHGLEDSGSVTFPFPSPVGGEVGWGELGRAEQISAAKVCISRAPEHRDVPRDASNFMAGFFFFFL